MALRQFIAASMVLLAVSPLAGCGKSKAATALQDNINACLAKKGLTNVVMDVPFEGEKPVFWERNRSPDDNVYYKHYDLQRRTVTKTDYNGGHPVTLGTLPYDQLYDVEKKRMDVFEECLNAAGSPQPNPPNQGKGSQTKDPTKGTSLGLGRR